MEFRYEAVNAQGQTVAGQVSAGGEREAARFLREQSLIPLELVRYGAPDEIARGKARRVSDRDKAIVIRELAILLQAGVSLAEAVDSIGQSHSGTDIGIAFSHIHGRLRSGESFSQGLRSAPIFWPNHVHQLVAAAEHTGKLAQALQSAASQMEYEQRVRTEMRSALLYPAILVVSGIVATLMIFIVVVPKFAGILKSNRAQVPEISVWVLSAGLFVREHLVAVALVTAALLVGVWRLLASEEGRGKLLAWLSRVPILGRWLFETEIGRWAAMLATLLENRVPILRALEIAREGARLAEMRHGLAVVHREVRGGRKLADALAGLRLLDVTGLNLVRVGERSGELAAMLHALAALHESAGRERLKRFLILLEPLAIIVIGCVIGVVMVAVMLAVTSLSNVKL